MTTPDNFIVRFLMPDGRGSAGVGALVGPVHIMTCAHVVNAALGLNQRAQGRPEGPVRIAFPFLGEETVLTARVAVWRPPPKPGVPGDDVAGLVVEGALPAGAVPGWLAAETPPPNSPVRVCGFTPDRPDGCWVQSIVRGTVANRRLQLDSGPESALRVQPGFSGGPVVDDSIGRLVGLVAESAATANDSRAISVDVLREIWPEVLGRAVNSPSARTEVTILHLSGTRFGNTGSGATGDALPWEALTNKLYRDIAQLGDRHGLRPDLLVVSGDLANSGMPREYEQATEFLGTLAGSAGIPRRHVAIVPGSHDVNVRKCAAHFSDREGDGLDPLPPYFPKWSPYANAFEEFFAGKSRAAFTPDEPWSLFEMPELGVVVAGLNSTMAESHRDEDRYGQVGPEQLRWFARRLAEYGRGGWLRLAAAYHALSAGDAAGHELRDADELDTILGEPGLINLLLSAEPTVSRPRRLASGVPVLTTSDIGASGLYELVTVRPGGFTRHVRGYRDGEWTVSQAYGEQALSTSHDFANAYRVFPPPAQESPEDAPERKRPDFYLVGGSEDDRWHEIWIKPDPYWEFFNEVVAATQTKFPNASLEGRPDERYLRVWRPLPGNCAELSLVGVIHGEVTEAAVREFADGVHGQFSSANPQIRSELVCSGPPPPPPLAALARRRGIRLCSFVEYQGVLDLRPLASAQRQRLDTDRIYPAGLYVEQRYRVISGGDHRDRVRTGLIGQATDWLRADVARLVVVLGDFGRGKTSFLRQLTRLLPSELPDVTPVLVELRDLEKGPTLDDLLAQHLVRHGVEDVSTAKLRYMIENGRVALLFDGFDELELRVGYDTAADYLQSLLNSVTDKAKLILTSRTQHFRSGQVLTALGKRVETRAGGRVVVLEDFTEDQIRQFLTNLYDGDSARAQRRFELIGHISNLLELTRNPRMLAFVAELDERRLLAVQAEGDRISAAGLYEEIIDYWLSNEEERQRHRRGLAALSKDERFTVCTNLALGLWQSNASSISLRELTAEVTHTLSKLAERGFTGDQAAHSIASGSLLIRTDDDTFTFVHQSIMEWLVAAHAARELAETGTTETLRARQMSSLMAAFFTDLAGLAVASTWSENTLAADEETAIAKDNAVTVLKHLIPEPRDCDLAPVRHSPARIDLRGQDLRGQDLNGQDLRGANLSGANLRGMRLDGVDLTGADLTGANFTGVTMTGGSLRDAILTDSVWTRAAILGTELGNRTTAPELSAAAIAGRDNADPMVVPSGDCESVAYSPDGALLAVTRGTAVQLTDTETGTTLRVLHGHEGLVTAVAFSPDGTSLATASDDHTARVWDLTTGTLHTTLTGHDDRVYAVAYSPDGIHIATASADATTRIWDPATGTTHTTLTGHEDIITAVAYSPDGTHIATASWDNTARIWNPADGTLNTTLSGHGGYVYAIAYSPDGNTLATASEDRTARIWASATGTLYTTLTGHERRVTAVAYSPDGNSLATASWDNTARTWDPADGTSHTTLTGRNSPVYAIAYSPDGNTLATASADTTTRIWDLTTGITHTTLIGRNSPVSAIAYSPDGNTLATVSIDGITRIWDTATAPLHTMLTGRNSPVSAIAYSPDGNTLATVSIDGIACIWDTADGTLHTTLPRHDSAVSAIAYSPDGNTLATADKNGITRIWDTATATLHTTLPRHDSAVSAIAYSPDGTRLATASRDGTAWIWDLNKARQSRVTRVRRSHAAVEPERILRGHTGAITALAFHPSGTMLATASMDGTAQIWNVGSGTRRAVLLGHYGRIRAIAYSPDGARLVTGADDGTVRIWDSVAATTLVTLIPLPEGGYATLLPDGSYKLKGDPGDQLWWAMKLCRFAPGELDPYVPGLRKLDEAAPIF